MAAEHKKDEKKPEPSTAAYLMDALKNMAAGATTSAVLQKKKLDEKTNTIGVRG